MIGKTKLAADVGVALEAHRFGGAGRRERGARAKAARLGAARGEAMGWKDLAAGIRVEAARPMTGFAAGAERIGSLGNQTGVIGGGEALAELFVALFALLGTDVFRAGHIRQDHDRTADRAAGNDQEEQEHRNGRQHQPPQPERAACCQFADVAIIHNACFIPAFQGVISP